MSKKKTYKILSLVLSQECLDFGTCKVINSESSGMQHVRQSSSVTSQGLTLARPSIEPTNFPASKACLIHQGSGQRDVIPKFAR